jgi:ADP-ribose pyrophosphatase YjhB (NUDIX family)
MWVFPGGRVDPEDGVDEEGARRAAARETLEEAGLVLEPEVLVPFAHWTPPPIAPKRFATWFFVAPAPTGIVAIDGHEIHDHVWVTPAEAMRRRDVGEIDLAPPTFVTLHKLAQLPDVDSVIREAAAGPVEYFSTRVAKSASGVLYSIWHGDSAYEGGDIDAEGSRHRLAMREGAWLYERD